MLYLSAVLVIITSYTHTGIIFSFWILSLRLLHNWMVQKCSKCEDDDECRCNSTWLYTLGSSRVGLEWGGLMILALRFRVILLEIIPTLPLMFWFVVFQYFFKWFFRKIPAYSKTFSSSEFLHIHIESHVHIGYFQIFFLGEICVLLRGFTDVLRGGKSFPGPPWIQHCFGYSHGQ